MAADIVPKLYEAIKTDYLQNISKNRKINAFLRRLEAGTATGEQVSLYSAELGKCAADALAKHLTEENLPDSRMYFNIGDRTIRPILEDVHARVMDAAQQVQEQEDKKAGIGMKSVRPEFPAARVRDLIFKFVEIFDKEEVADED